MLSWIKFSDQIMVHNFDECKCEKCGKDYDKNKKLNWIRTQSEFPFIFCDDCYLEVIKMIDGWITPNS